MEYNDIREQKLKELKTQLAEQQEKQRKQEDAEIQIDEVMKTVLSTEARTRLANVRLVNKQLYLKTAQLIIYLYRTGKITGKMTEQQLKEILKKLSEKKEVKIKRK